MGESLVVTTWAPVVVRLVGPMPFSVVQCTHWGRFGNRSVLVSLAWQVRPTLSGLTAGRSIPRLRVTVLNRLT